MEERKLQRMIFIADRAPDGEDTVATNAMTRRWSIHVRTPEPQHKRPCHSPVGNIILL